jgi:hypothetical protein
MFFIGKTLFWLFKRFFKNKSQFLFLSDLTFFCCRPNKNDKILIKNLPILMRRYNTKSNAARMVTMTSIE